MTKNWDDGYVSDIEYVPGFYNEQTPAHIETICITNGVESPVIVGEGFTYCELGCGLGETSLAIAAVNPKADVWAFDFNPAHIAGARKLAKKAGIDNVHFDENSFKDLAEGRVPENLPKFDYITMHGVWSWINDENRAYIVEFLSNYLKPSGIVYVSYNALPGWSNIIPLRNLMFMLANDEIGSTDQRAIKALKKMNDMLKDGARFLPADMADTLSKNPSYLSHEYLNASWDPTFHAAVANDLAEAKLSYFGTANIVENYLEYAFTPQQQEHLKAASPELRETLKDYFLDRTFRKDLFIRGKRNYLLMEAMERIENTLIQLVVPADEVQYAVRVPLGQVTLSEEFYKPIVTALDKNTRMRIADLLKLPEIKDKDALPNELLAMLLGSGQAKCSIDPAHRAKMERIRNFNKIIVQEAIKRRKNQSLLACGATGHAIYISYHEMFAYAALADGVAETVDDLCKAVAERISKRADQITVDDKKYTTPKEIAEYLKPHMETIITKSIPLWKSLGAI